MNLTAQLRGVLRSDIVTADHDQKVELTEAQPERGYPMTYTVAELPSEAVVVDISRFGHWGGIAETGDLQKHCDYLVVSPVDDGDRYYALLIEMKVTLTADSKPREQLRRSGPIVEYLRHVCAVEYSGYPPIEIRYVIVAEKESSRLDKQATKVGPLSGRPETYRGLHIQTFVGRGARFEEMVK